MYDWPHLIYRNNKGTGVRHVGVGFIPILTFCEIISQTSQLGCQKLSAVCKCLCPHPYIGTIRMYDWNHPHI